MTDPVWVLTGPTAAGKSSLAITLADECRRASRPAVEILSMDSMAVYRRMDIGTAKPDREQRARVPHHLIDLVEPHEPFDTHRWCQRAERALAAVRGRGAQPLFVGGTPLYLMAFFKGLMSAPGADPELRARLQERERQEPGGLHRLLAERDPSAAGRIHRRDVKRLVRALEVIAHTGSPISAGQQQFDRPGWRVPCRVVALSVPREELHRRVRQRTIEMLEGGLLDEVRAIREAGGFSAQAAAAIGYRECLDYLDGDLKDIEELRNRIRRATHRLIRRQITWLRRMPDIHWITAVDARAGLLARMRDRSCPEG